MKKICLFLIVVMVISTLPLSVFAISDTVLYTMTVKASKTENPAVGDVIPVNVEIDTTNGIQGIQFMLNYDTEAFEINTSGNAYINTQWKSYFNALSSDSVPKNYSFTPNVNTGKIAALEYGFFAVSESNALKNVSLMGVNLIVKDAEKAKASKIYVNNVKISSSLSNNVKFKTTDDTISDSENTVSLFFAKDMYNSNIEVNPISVTNLIGNSFTVNADMTKENDGTVLVGLYDESGLMTECKILPAAEASDVAFENEGKTVRIMWWDLTELSPKIEAFDFEL